MTKDNYPKVDLLRIKFLDGKFQMILLIEDRRGKHSYGPIDSEGAFYKFADIMVSQWSGTWPSRELAIARLSRVHRLNKHRRRNDADQPYPYTVGYCRPKQAPFSWVC